MSQLYEDIPEGNEWEWVLVLLLKCVWIASTADIILTDLSLRAVADIIIGPWRRSATNGVTDSSLSKISPFESYEIGQGSMGWDAETKISCM